MDEERFAVLDLRLDLQEFKGMKSEITK